METKDLFYIGALAYLAYLLAKKNSSNVELKKKNVDSTALKNGGLNLGQNMDLPNLTPTPEDGMSTEDSLNQGNISPLIKEDNEPTQIFGASLPFGVQNFGYQPTTVNQIIESIGTTPKPSNLGSLVGNSKTIGVEQKKRSTKVVEPIFNDLRTLKKVETDERVLPNFIMPEADKNALISQCGNSFSIPNNDKEASYTNYWFDGNSYYMQTSSPMIKTAVIRISKDLYLSACQKLLQFKTQAVSTPAPTPTPTPANKPVPTSILTSLTANPSKTLLVVPKTKL